MKRERNHAKLDPGAGDGGAPPSPRRRTVFRVVAALAPVLLVVVVELALRLAGWGGRPPVVIPVGREGDGTLYITNRTAPAVFFKGPASDAGAMREHAFVQPKPAGTLRIVLAGGSAIEGFPQPAGLGASAFLEEMLRAVLPGRSVEVINVGATAVASFPACRLAEALLPYAPDWVILYSGHNEYFGASGVASMHAMGRSPAAIRARHAIDALAIVQAGGALWRGSQPPASPHLMERAAARQQLAPDDPVRAQAEHNLETHARELVEACREAGTGAIVCTVACNERDLAPIGRWPAATAEAQSRVDELLAQASRADAHQAAALLGEALDRAPDDALVHFRWGQNQFAAQRADEAAKAFQKAINLDAMPWRAPSRSNEALRRAARASGAPLCDVVAYFRAHSPQGCIGDELFDDHVHFSLAGQWLLARALLETLIREGRLEAAAPDWEAHIPSLQQAAGRLGANGYEAFGVAHQMAILFEIPFMKSSNPQQLERFARMRAEYLAQMPPSLRSIAETWARPAESGALRRCLSAGIAAQLAAEGRPQDAVTLWRLAAASDPPLSVWHFEDVYGLLRARRTLQGSLTAEDAALARRTIGRIRLLAASRPPPPGVAELWTGRLQVLLGEHAEALGTLSSARATLQGVEQVQADQAYVEACVNIGRLEEARRVVAAGIARGGAWVTYYEEMRAALPQP